MNFNTDNESRSGINKNNDNFMRSLRIAAIVLSIVDVLLTILSFRQTLKDYRERKED